MGHGYRPVSTSRSSSQNSLIEKARREKHHDADVVIVGAGIAGCAIAAAMGNQGRSVILLERALKEPDRIVGELLQPGGVQALEKLGLKDCLENIDAIPVHGYQVIYHAEPVNIPYPEDPKTAKRPQGRSFHHGRFISRLRAAATATPNVTVIESTVTSLIKTDYTGQVLGVEAKTAGQKACYFGQITFITDGYASNFRSVQREQKPVSKSKFYGLELTDCVLPAAYHGHVLLGDFSPVLLYQIGRRETRILVDIPDGCPTAAASVGGVTNHMLQVVLPILPQSVQPSFIAAIQSGQQIRSMPNSWLPPKLNKVPGVIVLGDASNMRHPLTGGGMTVAFNDVVLLSELLSPENVPSLADSTKVLKQLETFHWKRKDVTSVINILAQALYTLFAANDTNLRALQLGCFEYFKLGGDCLDGPCGLLAGIIRNPWVLIYHFFRVALYAIWIDAMTYPLIFLPFVLLWRGFSLLKTACIVIFPYIFAELRK